MLSLETATFLSSKSKDPKIKVSFTTALTTLQAITVTNQDIQSVISKNQDSAKSFWNNVLSFKNNVYENDRN